jgi:hypothetical protein
MPPLFKSNFSGLPSHPAPELMMAPLERYQNSNEKF